MKYSLRDLMIVAALVPSIGWPTPAVRDRIPE
jgi:hypothetical protein